MKEKTILFIEDDKDILTSASDILEESGFKVIPAENGIEALGLIKKQIPDLIISDIMMPKMNGLELKSELEKEKETSKIPFIFLTAKAGMDDLRKGMETGADDYIVKPFKAKELLKSIEIRFNKINSGNEFQSNENETTSVSEKLTIDDAVFLNLNDNPSFIKIKDIKVISAESEYSYIFLASSEKYLVRKLLKEWEQILPEKSFIRIHRSTIVNLNYIEKVEKWFQRSFKITIKNLNDDFIISQRYASKLKGNFIK